MRTYKIISRLSAIEDANAAICYGKLFHGVALN